MPPTSSAALPEQESGGKERTIDDEIAEMKNRYLNQEATYHYLKLEDQDQDNPELQEEIYLKVFKDRRNDYSNLNDAKFMYGLPQTKRILYRMRYNNMQLRNQSND